MFTFALVWDGLPPAALTALTVFVAFVLIAFFAGSFGLGIAQTWRAQPGNPPNYSDAFVYVATALASLVGGIVAVAFNATEGLSKAVDWVTVLTIVYSVTYVLFGVAALLTWMFKARETPILLKNLATTFLGLAITIVATFFGKNLHLGDLPAVRH